MQVLEQLPVKMNQIVSILRLIETSWNIRTFVFLSPCMVIFQIEFNVHNLIHKVVLQIRTSTDIQSDFNVDLLL